MAGVCLGVGIACLLYYMILVSYAGITADFAWIWLLAACACGVGGVLVRYGKSHPGFCPVWVRGAVLAALAAGMVVFLVLGGRVLHGMKAAGSPGLDYVVVLGAQVKGDKPSRALKKRLDKALAYALENENTILILSGGQGSGEDITEAQCMAEYLTEKGISPKRLVLEERSTNTKENLEFSEELTGCGSERTGILSNNFHVYRAVRLAKKLGYKRAEGIAAPSDAVMQVHYVVREVFALVKELAKGNI